MRETIKRILDKNYMPTDDGLVELMYSMVINKKSQMEIAGELRYSLPPSMITKSTNQHVYNASTKLSSLYKSEIKE